MAPLAPPFRTTWRHPSPTWLVDGLKCAGAAISSGLRRAAISMLTRAFPLPLPGPAAPGMAAGDQGLWASIRLHPCPDGRRARSETPRGCGEGLAALPLPARGWSGGQSCPAERPGLPRPPPWGSRAGPASPGAAHEPYADYKIRSC